MAANSLSDKYFNWMCQIVSDGQAYVSRRGTFKKLLAYLYDTPFAYTICMDGNRAEDGIDLRYRFGEHFHYSDPVIASNLDNRPCSILEMMVALAIRCEEHIMEDSDIGDRTGQWFWGMIVSLGLDSMTDNRFDYIYVSNVVERFLNREYDPDGKGSLFTVPGERNMRTTEIWYQMHLYLNTIL